MASHSKGKSARLVPEHPGLTSWREASLNGPPLILRLVNEAMALSPIMELRQAASVTLSILKNIQIVKENKEAYARLGDDASGLVVVIWNSYKKTEFPNEWLSMEMREILEDLTHTLENICSFVQEHISKKRGIRVILSKGDAGKKISEYREHLNYAMQKFELQSQMNINDVLMQIMRKNDQLSDQILHRNEEDDINHALEITARVARDQELAEKIYEEELEKSREISRLERLKQVEIDHQVEDQRLHSEQLKKIEKEAKDRKTELERLRAAASVVEEVNRLRKAEEEEIAQLKRTLAAEEDNRRSNTTQAQSSRKDKSSREEDEIDEEEWVGNFIVEAATSEEEEEHPVKRSSKEKRNRSAGSPRRRPVTLEDSTDDEEDLRHRKSSRTRTAHRKPSRTSFRVDETEDESTDYQDHVPPRSRKNRKANRRPQSLPRSPPLQFDVDGLMDQIKENFIPFGRNLNGSISDSYIGSPTYTHSNPYFPTYGALVSPPLGPYGYLPGTIVNSGVGNITNATIANVGNDNSVKKVYRR